MCYLCAKKINGHTRMPNFYGTSIGIDSYVSGVYSINLIQIITIRWNNVKFIYIVDGRATQNRPVGGGGASGAQAPPHHSLLKKGPIIWPDSSSGSYVY